MTTTHPPQWTELLPADRPAALLLRHAEREPILTPEESLTAPLTAGGRRRAEELGRRLARFPRLVLHHSPVGRCRQTAEAVARGAEDAGCPDVKLAGELRVLGGPYMLDWRTVMPRFLERGAGPFMRDWFAGRQPPGLVRDSRQSARQQLEHLQEQVSSAGAAGLFLNVSHDINVLLVRHFYLEHGQELFGWPEYLEALALYRDGDAWRLRRGELVRTLEPGEPA